MGKVRGVDLKLSHLGRDRPVRLELLPFPFEQAVVAGRSLRIVAVHIDDVTPLDQKPYP
jgi:hypothetical protein